MPPGRTQCIRQLDLGILHRKQVTGRFDGDDISREDRLVLFARALDLLGSPGFAIAESVGDHDDRAAATMLDAAGVAGGAAADGSSTWCP
ncbi:MAG: hypothetical protein HPY44_17360 [Armatimonadetes bacterium]|nr:hypothetical protein [Armatimonadota bacterium]